MNINVNWWSICIAILLEQNYYYYYKSCLTRIEDLNYISLGQFALRYLEDDGEFVHNFTKGGF